MVQHISVEEIDRSEEEDAAPSLKTFVFDTLQPSISQKRPSIFARMVEGPNLKPSVFQRIKENA